MSTKLIRIFILISFVFSNLASCSPKQDGTFASEVAKNKVYFESNATGRDTVIDKVSFSRHNAITRAVEIAVPAVVSINVIQTIEVVYQDPFDVFRNDPLFRFFFEDVPRRKYYREYNIRGLGSGFIISPDGYILTNYHVVEDATKIVVTTTSGDKYDAKIVGLDKYSDVALLKIDAKNLPYLKLGNSDEVLLGEWVIALGNPFGLFDLNSKPTITVGVVSNKNVNLNVQDKIYKNMIQTDASISSGNSGGPLINSLGEVIGINTIIFSTAQSSTGAGSIGIGWAIPINRAKQIINKIIDLKAKEVRNVDLGMKFIEPNSRQARYFKGFTNGLLVAECRGVAAKAGIEPGDIILEINGIPVNSVDDYYSVLIDTYIGDTLTFKIKREEKIIEIKLINSTI